jgi:hypothetical protein
MYWGQPTFFTISYQSARSPHVPHSCFTLNSFSSHALHATSPQPTASVHATVRPAVVRPTCRLTRLRLTAAHPSPTAVVWPQGCHRRPRCRPTPPTWPRAILPIVGPAPVPASPLRGRRAAPHAPTAAEMKFLWFL